MVNRKPAAFQVRSLSSSLNEAEEQLEKNPLGRVKKLGRKPDPLRFHSGICECVGIPNMGEKTYYLRLFSGRDKSNRPKGT